MTYDEMVAQRDKYAKQKHDALVNAEANYKKQSELLRNYFKDKVESGDSSFAVRKNDEDYFAKAVDWVEGQVRLVYDDLETRSFKFIREHANDAKLLDIVYLCTGTAEKWLIDLIRNNHKLTAQVSELQKANNALTLSLKEAEDKLAANSKVSSDNDSKEVK